jgi:hypothetical protein
MYRAIVKRIKTENGKRLFSLVHYDSVDGIAWKPAKHHDISERIVERENGKVQQFTRLERPQVFFEDDGSAVLLCAADTLDAHNVRQSFNIQIPLLISQKNYSVF